ncbi:putative D-amino acid oxidase [Sulfuriferula plumbiphila]|uniref:Putative D-amino acid oxidase n=1 Tax=Sulfuriferula plumbiphila TaxID=171865 RepID=A0A512L9M8_9PROT|nr:glycine oxidase ThiO [Sulfuriferula plumbiphila]BBP03680.1 putative D-amino acid oxidase [Sulfuriferula plumbiphila]GEP31190.1 putative D-amino acid oxidase [Sulfuriferula plumbiphila]
MNPDFLIIGGGVIGLSSALELAREGARVTVLERGVAGAESSWAGGGILSPLLPWDYPDTVSRLCDLGVELYPHWSARLTSSSGIDPEFRVSGMLVLPPVDDIAAGRWCAQHGWRHAREHAQARVPALAENSPALWLPDVAQVRNPRLVQALRVTALDAGVNLLEGVEVTQVARASPAHIDYLDTPRGKLQASAYVIAAGAWSQSVLGNIAPHWPIKPMRGQMLLFKAAPNLLPHIVYRQGIYLIPRRDGHILAGSTVEDAGFDKSTTETVKRMLYNAATNILPALQSVPLVQHWSGLRPGSPDNIPTIGRHPLVENLYANTGHFRYGVTMAPASAQILADLIAGRPQTLDVAPYRWTAM